MKKEIKSVVPSPDDKLTVVIPLFINAPVPPLRPAVWIPATAELLAKGIIVQVAPIPLADKVLPYPVPPACWFVWLTIRVSVVKLFASAYTFLNDTTVKIG